jgi:hypothetical protein
VFYYYKKFEKLCRAGQCKKMDLYLKDLAALLYASGKMLCRRTKDKDTLWYRVE